MEILQINEEQFNRNQSKKAENTIQNTDLLKSKILNLAVLKGTIPLKHIEHHEFRGRNKEKELES